MCRPLAFIWRLVGKPDGVPFPESRVPTPWDRDEWDVALAEGPTYRLFRERHSDKWFLEGVVD